MSAVSLAVRPLGDVLRAYVSLMKLRIVALLLFVTLATMLVAAEGWPATSTVVLTLLAGALSAGGANAINCYLDRDIDAIMARTRGRAIPSRRVAPRHALLFGISIAAAAFVIFATLVNPLAAFISLGALLFYVLVYTVWLKRTTPQNIVIGGAAGAAPPLVGWAAVTGHLAPAAFVLFAIIFVWTPPHFWALALLLLSDYQRAGVPMLPVVKGEAESYRQIILYSIVLLAVTLVLIPVHSMGWVYLGASLLLGGLFVGMAVYLARAQSRRAARRLFSYSILYLVLLFLAMVADKVAT